jgi:hypothetical protein
MNRSSDPSAKQNPFFRDLYANLARLLRDPVHPLFGFEAREHTAQVDGEKRAAAREALSLRREGA